MRAVHMKKVHLIGAIVASLAFLIVIFAGTFGQLFTLSGRTAKMPSYGTTAIPNSWDIGYADSLTYDEKGKFIDFAKMSGVVGASENNPGDTCPDRTYVFSVKDLKVWKKGSMLESVQKSIQRQIEPVLKACAPPAGTDFACASGCKEDGEEQVIEAQPLTQTLLSADAVAHGILQYVFSLNTGCVRIKHCVAS